MRRAFSLHIIFKPAIYSLLFKTLAFATLCFLLRSSFPFFSLAPRAKSVPKTDIESFKALEKYAECPTAVGGVIDYDDTDLKTLRTSLGPFLKFDVIGKEVPHEYLITSELLAIFMPDFTNAQNWDFGKDIYCFPSFSKDFHSWYERLAFHLEAKWKRLGISTLIRITLSPLTVNPKVCAALLAFWNSSLNCFMFPEGPMSITLEDIYFLTGCSAYGENLRLTPCLQIGLSFVSAASLQ